MEDREYDCTALIKKAMRLKLDKTFELKYQRSEENDSEKVTGYGGVVTNARRFKGLDTATQTKLEQIVLHALQQEFKGLKRLYYGKAIQLPEYKQQLEALGQLMVDKCLNVFYPDINLEIMSECEKYLVL